jgi:prepilin-type N-terminal cleavage/methylation domain-containing protein
MNGSLKMTKMLRGSKGISLIELMVALVISAILIAALYRTFISQQKTYNIQEQVVDMQQNARLSVSKMMKEIRMAGFGGVANFLQDGTSKMTFGSTDFYDVITHNTPAGGLTVITVGGETTISTDPVSSNQIQVASLTDSQGNTLFNTTDRRHISVGGLGIYQITNVETGTKTLTLNGNLLHNPKSGTPVAALRAISYKVDANTLKRGVNLGAGLENVADNITSLQLQYLDAAGAVIANPVAQAANIRVVKVTVTARTGMADPDYKSGGGFRTRTITSNIQVRNMGLGS